MSPQSSPSHASRKRSSPPRATRIKSRFVAQAEPEIEEVFSETPPIISAEEKHQLIMAHTQARPLRDPLQQATLWGGVMIAFGAILVGWFFTVGHQVKLQISSGGNMQALTQRLNRFTESVNGNSVLQKGAVGNPSSEADAAEFSGMLKQLLGTTSTPAQRDDLIAPGPASASANSTTSTKSTSTAPQGFVPVQHQ